MAGRKKELWKNYASTETVNAVERCGRQVGPYYTRCRRLACRTCRMSKLWQWHDADAAWSATAGHVWHVVGKVAVVDDIAIEIARQKSRLRSMIARTGCRMSARGFVLIEPGPDDLPVLAIHLLVSDGGMGSAMMTRRIAALWPNARIERYAGDLGTAMWPMVSPVETNPKLRAAYYSSVTFRQSRIAFGGRRFHEDHEAHEPMPVAL